MYILTEIDDRCILNTDFINLEKQQRKNILVNKS